MANSRWPALVDLNHGIDLVFYGIWSIA